MGDEGGFDPCECIFNHEMAMRRLLSLLRSSQTVCNDHECNDGSVLPSGGPEGNSDFLMLTMVWMLVAAMLYMLRPASMRSSGDSKPNNNNNNSSNNEDPEPPTVM